MVYSECLFFDEFVIFMLCGFIVVMVIEVENVIEKYCVVIGVIDLVNVVEGIICKFYGSNVGENVVYGLDVFEMVV